jgi:hypothetical protein
VVEDFGNVVVHRRREFAVSGEGGLMFRGGDDEE